MSDFFLGEIRPFAFGYAPYGWHMCNGATLNINQYAALYALLGTTYGGNGTTTFMLPNIQGEVIVGTGQLLGGSNYTWGQTGGAASVNLVPGQMPVHNHTFNTASAGLAAAGIANETNAPATNATSYLSNFIGKNNATPPSPVSGFGYTHTTPVNTQMGQNSVAAAGGGQPHENRAPYVVINYCINLQGGEFPVRS